MNFVIYISKYQASGVPVPDLFFTEVLPAFPESGAGHQYILITDGYQVSEFAGLVEAGFIVLPAPVRNNIAARLWWRSVTLPRLLRKYAADVVLMVNALIPVGTLKSFAWFQDNQGWERIKKAASSTVLITSTEWQSNALAARFPLNTTVTVKPTLPSASEPLGSAQKASTREEFTGGKMFFLYAGPLDKDLTDLVRAFSVFKKRQKSDWKLVLAGEARKDDVFIKSLQHYRYRDDVVVLDGISWSALRELMAAAYALVSPADQSARWLIDSGFQAGVPVLVRDTALLREEGGEALLYMGQASQTEIAETMMTIYKDENLRSVLVGNGERELQGRSAGKMAAELRKLVAL